MPFSTIWPLLTTAMTSQFWMVDSRWAIVTVVRLSLAMISSSAACTTFSLSLSSALVASSKRRIGGLRMSARAMATRCFCPPLSLPPPWPTCVS
mmetsp:Transcript_52276/g.138865  ORF Transcript_52276/g.138865 Transcript_52276/m.138865 type:complete len:94 (+) Transcript_52276:96-377(+)